MPGTPTARYGLTTMSGNDSALTIDSTFNETVGQIDSRFAGASQGVFASRPVSTPGVPGVASRFYYATDTKKFYQDFGTGWLELRASESPSSGKSIIPTSEGRTNAAYGLLATPDRVSGIVLPADGLIVVAYQATWQESVNGAARAAVFLGTDQLKVGLPGGVPLVQAAAIGGTPAVDTPLASCSYGLGSSSSAGAALGDVTTGQVIGSFGGGVIGAIGAGALGPMTGAGWGVCQIFAAAGTYDVSVQFKASSGSVFAKNRKLWVEAKAF